MKKAIPRSEYPRPQFRRDEWQCLNGEWQFEIDSADTGLERGLLQRELTDKITVPFCPESSLSGIGHLDFMEAVWYRREITVPQAWNGRHIRLHFQAVDYETTVWIDGQEAVKHRGGSTPFECELTPAADSSRKYTVVVRARDAAYEHKPGGKQTLRQYQKFGCYYWRTTGIWQTVWMEPVGASYLKRTRITPDLANRCFHLEQPIVNRQPGMKIRAILSNSDGEVARAESSTDLDLAARLILEIPKKRLQLWEPGQPFLYDLKLELLDAAGQTVDTLDSYAGMRSVCLIGKKFLINGKPVFQRQVLDQGYYPDGILTAPSDDALKRDIELSMAAGFNSARLHQKIFEERFLYHADRLGYLVWGEQSDWGIHHNEPGYKPIDAWQHQPHLAMVVQWLEELERDYSHPAIIGWCGVNESHERDRDHVTALGDMTRGIFLAAKAMDTSRPVLDASGYSHLVPETDIYDCHDYTQAPAEFARQMSGLAQDKPFQDACGAPLANVPYRGQPWFCSEFGGIRWNPDDRSGEGWGYGDGPKTLKEFYERFAGLCKVLLDDPNMFGYCYTQLTDVFQEQNGIYRFDREAKFDQARLAAVQRQTAACEKE